MKLTDKICSLGCLADLGRIGEKRGQMGPMLAPGFIDGGKLAVPLLGEGIQMGLGDITWRVAYHVDGAKPPPISQYCVVGKH